MRNIKTREGYEFWDKICAVQSYAFLLSPDGRRVVKTPDIGDWIDKHEAQVIVDHAQEEFNAVKAERDALHLLLNDLEEQNHSLEQRRHAEQQACQAAERRISDCDIESAAKVLANCMDYPWEHMPENGRALMRKHAKDVIDAALNPTAEAESHE